SLDLISEVDASGSSSYLADWFEVTNVGPSDVNIAGWKIDDSSNAFASAVALRNIAGLPAATSIPLGKSAVFFGGAETGTTDGSIASVPGTQTTAEDIAVKVTGISVADVDVNEGTGVIKVTLSVSSGKLTVQVGVAGGLAATWITGNGTCAVVLQDRSRRSTSHSPRASITL